MEILIDRIAKFLAVSDGYGRNGYGDGLGNGYGYGDGYGIGFGNGNGKGRGFGIGDGYGRNGYGNGYGNGLGSNGLGNGLTSINGQSVNLIDNVPTIITQVRGNLALGYALRYNIIKVPCYIAKCGNYFAHGKTAKEAMTDAKAKYDRNRPIGERIEEFVKAYPSLDSIAKHKDLFEWHNVLTGSCKFGREEFCKANGLDPNKGKMSVRTFIGLTIDSYGGDIIQTLLYRYDNDETSREMVE